MEWLTSGSAPWWATIVSTLLTFLLGNILSNRSVEKQRTADAAERRAERDAAATEAARRSHEDREQRKADAEAATEVARVNTVQQTRVAALSAIASLQAAVAGATVAERLKPSLVSDFLTAYDLWRSVEQNPDVPTVDEVERSIAEYVLFWADLDDVTIALRAERIWDQLKVLRSSLLDVSGL